MKIDNYTRSKSAIPCRLPCWSQVDHLSIARHLQFSLHHGTCCCSSVEHQRQDYTQVSDPCCKRTTHLETLESFPPWWDVLTSWNWDLFSVSIQKSLCRSVWSSCGFSSSHMWELDYEESWAPKNWCFQIVALEKTLESPLDCKESKPVNSTLNPSFIFLRCKLSMFPYSANVK